MSRRNPYKLFDFYTDADAGVFFGREAEVSAVVGDILANKLLVLFARSGSGKTSLLNAGIGPALREVGRVDEDDPGIRMVTIRLAGNMTPEQSALQAVRNALGSDIPSDVQTLHEALRRTCSFTEERTSGSTGLVLVFDQFEELFISLFKDHTEVRREFAEQLAQIIHDDTLRAYVVLSLRSDHFHHLNEFRNLIPSIFQNNTNLELRPFDDEAALRVIRGPAEGPDIGFDWEAGLPERIVTDLKAMNEDRDGVLPIHLQIVCHGLWESLKSDEHQITLQHYKTAAHLDRHAANPSPAAAMVRQRIIAPLEVAKGRKRRYLLRTLRELITRHQTKTVRSLSELVEAIPKQRLMPILEHLEGALLLRRESAAEDDWFELRHDYLAREITPWLEEQEHALKARDRRLLEGIMAVLVVTAVVGTKLWYDWNSYVAKIGSPDHPDELIISRQPAFGLYTPSWWRLQITTGFLRPQLQAGGVPKYHFEVPKALADWSEVEPHLHEQERWALQLAARPMGRAGGASADSVRAASVDPVLFEAVRHGDIGLYAAADPRILALVKQVLEEGNAAAKRDAVYALGAAAESLDAASAQAVIADLRQALKDADVRGAAAEALGTTAQALDAASAQAVVADLRQVLKDADVKRTAVEALGATVKFLDAASAQAVVGDLRQALKDANPSVRDAAAEALGTAAQSLDAASAQAVVADLRQALKDADAGVKRTAALTLGAMAESLEQTSAQAIATELLQALKEDTVGNQAGFVLALRAVTRHHEHLEPQSAQGIATELLQGFMKKTNTDKRRFYFPEERFDLVPAAIAVAAARLHDPGIAGTALLILTHFNGTVSTSGHTIDFREVRRMLASSNWRQTDNELITWLTHYESKYRAFAAHVLAQRQPLDTELLARIRDLRDDPQGRPWVKMAALRCLVEIERERLARKQDAKKEQRGKAEASETED